MLEGRPEDATKELGEAVAKFERGGLWLDAWHAGWKLAEAEHATGDVEAARRKLTGIVAGASASGALLAAMLARDTAARLGLDIGAAPSTDGARPAAPRVATGERLVSVLFADVRGYTQLSSESAPADMAARIASMQRWATQEVERRHGIVDKFAGDAVMATFNVAGQSVDHTLQALRAAIAIIDKAALAELPLGAAVAVGPGVVGNLAQAANLSVLGEVTNLASRLQSEARAGQVMLSEEAHRRVREWLDEHRLPVERVELALKGIGPQVTAYRVTAGLTVPA